MSTTKFQETNLEAYRGDRESYTFTVTSGGSAYNLTGYTIKAIARVNPDDGYALFDTTSTTGMAITDSSGGNSFATGIVILVITAAVTAILPPICYYDLQATSGSTVTTIARGKITTHKDVTR